MATTASLRTSGWPSPTPARTGLAPLTPLATFGDPVLAAYSTRKVEDQFGARRTRDVELAEISVGDGADDWWDDNAYVAITRKIAGYGEQPWTIGAYFKGSQIGGEIERVMGSAMLGLAAMAAAVIVAILLGKRLSKPIQAIAGQATRVADFDLDGVTPLPRSRIKELDDQASAFNAMLIGLRAFSTYIPRSLVAKLVRTGEIGIAEPRETIVTVMFTDIADFTALSEQMDAAAVSTLLNRHFAILCRAVDAHGGTVDKFLGDGMMAFFGAPDRLKGHAAAAVRAAAQIREDLAADNRVGRAGGSPGVAGADRHPYRPRHRRQHRCVRSRELHDHRRHRECQPEAARAGQGACARRRDDDRHFGRDRVAPRRPLRDHPCRAAQAARQG